MKSPGNISDECVFVGLTWTWALWWARSESAPAPACSSHARRSRPWSRLWCTGAWHKATTRERREREKQRGWGRGEGGGGISPSAVQSLMHGSPTRLKLAHPWQQHWRHRRSVQPMAALLPYASFLLFPLPELAHSSFFDCTINKGPDPDSIHSVLT